MIVNTKINKPRVTQKRVARAQNRPVTLNFTPERVRANIELLHTVANEEGWDNGLPTRKQIEVFGVMFDEFFEKYFSYFPEHTRQQAKDSAITLAAVMKDIAKDEKEIMFASLANYWYSRKEV